MATAVRPRADRPAPPAVDVRGEINTLQRDYETWARRLYRIRDKQGVIRPLVLNEVQRAIGRAEQEMLATRDAARILTLKGRQGGISTDQQARSLHQVWGTPRFDALTLAHEKDATLKIFEITQRALDHFPPALLPRLGGRETNEISFPGLDTHFYTGTAGSKRTGRGLTVKRFHGSEVFFWDALRDTLGTVTPALVPQGSVVVLESTASMYGSEGHEFWTECVTGANGYRALFFPWWQCDPVNYRKRLDAPDELGVLEDEEQDLVTRRGLDLEQIKWRRATMAELKRPLFLREYAEDADSCWMTAGEGYYDGALLKLLSLRVPVPVETHMGGALEVFVTPAQWARMAASGDRAIIGADTAEGAGKDRSTFEARSFTTDALLATFGDPNITPEGFGDLLDTWGRRYSSPTFGPALLAPEKNAHGVTVIRRLVDVRKYPAQCLYHRMVMDEANRLTPKLGWVTSEQSKPQMLDAARDGFDAAREGTSGAPTAAVLADAGRVRRGKSGVVELTGRDAIVAYMLTRLARSYPVRPLGGSAPRYASTSHVTV